MKNVISFLILIVVISNDVLGVDCITLSKKELYRNSDFIFIGKVRYGEDSSFAFSVKEIFKGEPDSIVFISTDDAPIFKIGQFWLIYADDMLEGFIVISSCSGSKQFDNPIGIHDSHQIRIPPNGILNDDLRYFQYTSDLYSDVYNELFHEISGLRQFKIEDELAMLKSENANLSDQLKLTKQYHRIIFGLLGLLIALQVFFGFWQYRK